MNLDIIIRSEASYLEKDISVINILTYLLSAITYMWNLKYGTHELIHETQT